jgi:hypothetical protein
MSPLQILAIVGGGLVFALYVMLVSFSVCADGRQMRFSLAQRVGLSVLIQGTAHALVLGMVYGVHPAHSPSLGAAGLSLVGLWLMMVMLLPQNVVEGCVVALIWIILLGGSVFLYEKVQRKAREVEVMRAAAEGKQAAVPPQDSGITPVPFAVIAIALAAAMLQRYVVAAEKE